MHVFKGNYGLTRVILCCTEIHLQQPTSLKLNTVFYSNYKSTTTLMGLVGITSSGAVGFISALHPGSVSDNAITRNSGMVDKGLTIATELSEHVCTHTESLSLEERVDSYLEEEDVIVGQLLPSDGW
ncbi:hypothetical protein LSAT2_032896 [Lamellibrachia satsuma]|nr:hypothetical protein LSAT2_032896 [Lamellibrachia satsuma]